MFSGMQKTHISTVALRARFTKTDYVYMRVQSSASDPLTEALITSAVYQSKWFSFIIIHFKPGFMFVIPSKNNEPIKLNESLIADRKSMFLIYQQTLLFEIACECVDKFVLFLHKFCRVQIDLVECINKKYPIM